MKKWLKLTLTFVVMVALSVALYFIGFQGDWIKPIVEGAGIWGYVIFLLIQTVIATALCFVPATTFTFTILAVQLFGFWGGFIIAFIGCWVSSQLMFLIGRYGGVKFVDWLVGEKDRIKAQELVSDRSTVLLPILLFIPFTPDDMFCMLAGMTKMRYRYFAIMSIFTRVLNIALTAFFGAGATWQYIVAALNGNIVLWILAINVLLIDIWLVWKFSGWVERKVREHRAKKEIVVVKNFVENEKLDETNKISMEIKNETN